MEPSDRIGRQKPQVAMWSPKTTHNVVFVLFSIDKDDPLLYSIPQSTKNVHFIDHFCVGDIIRPKIYNKCVKRP